MEVTPKAAKGHNKWRRRLLTFATALVVLVVAFKVIGYIKEKGIQEKISYAQREGLSRSDAVLADRYSYLKTFGITGVHAGSSRADVCWIDHDDAGWFAENYNQKCVIRSVTAFRTTLNPDQLKALISEELAQTDWSSGFSGCELASERYGEPTITVSTPEISGTNSDCSIPDPVDAQAVVAYAADGAHRKLISKSGTAWNDHKSTIIWIVHDDMYWDEALGCSFPKFIFCNSPRSDPIVAD